MTPGVADLSHHVWEAHGQLDFAKAKAAGIVGVIFKVTEGSTWRDDTYEKSRKLAQAAGLLWGAFHYGTAANVDAQVKSFLKYAEPDDDTFLALDFEYNSRRPSNTISKQQGVDFLAQCDAAVKRPLTLYTGADSMARICGPAPVAEFKTRRLWWAHYGDKTPVHPTWSNYWLWQYTDGKDGKVPHAVDGFGNCDLNIFDGTADALRRSWVE